MWTEERGRVPVGKKHSEECMLCGTELNHLERAVVAKCTYCGGSETSYFICPEGHFVCNSCHAKEALLNLTHYCLTTKATQPIQMLEELMQHPSVALHGPEHHAIVPAVLVTAYRNLTGNLSEEQILEAIRRGSRIPGGYCGIYGACGAGIGTGVAVSVVTGSTPLKAEPRALSNLMTSKALARISEMGGVRCCKACSRTAVEAAVDFFLEHWNCSFAKETFSSCNYIARNRQCNGNGCRYYPVRI